MTRKFKYSLLQYVHSELLNERVNIGVFIYFPDRNQPISFLYPDSLKRLKSTYPDLQEKKIEYYLHSIENKLSGSESELSLFSEENSIDSGFFNFIDNNILKIDDSAFQLSNLYESLLYTDNIESVKNDLFNEFFSYYSLKERIQHITDHHISNRFISKVSLQLKNYERSIKRNVKVETDNLHYTFDALWQNGTSNYVKALSLDCGTSHAIQDKSVKVYGSLSLIDDLVSSSNNRYDLLVARPTEKKLFKEFDNALRIIDKAPVNKEIIELSELDSYTQRLSNYLNSVI